MNREKLLNSHQVPMFSPFGYSMQTKTLTVEYRDRSVFLLQFLNCSGSFNNNNNINDI